MLRFSVVAAPDPCAGAPCGVWPVCLLDLQQAGSASQEPSTGAPGGIDRNHFRAPGASRLIEGDNRLAVWASGAGDASATESYVARYGAVLRGYIPLGTPCRTRGTASWMRSSPVGKEVAPSAGVRTGPRLQRHCMGCGRGAFAKCTVTRFRSSCLIIPDKCLAFVDESRRRTPTWCASGAGQISWQRHPGWESLPSKACAR